MTGTFKFHHDDRRFHRPSHGSRDDGWRFFSRWIAWSDSDRRAAGGAAGVFMCHFSSCWRQLRLAPASSCWPPAPAGASQFCSLDGRTVRGGVFVVVSIAKGEKARERFCLGAIRSDKISRKCRCDKISRDKRSKDVVVIRYLEINGIENNNGHKHALSYAQ